MPAPNAISADKLKRLIGLPSGPLILDVRAQHDGQLLPASVAWPEGHGPSPHLPEGRGVVVACGDGRALSQSIAALLRQRSVAAEVLEGGVSAWAAEGLPLIPSSLLPPRDALGRTLWVTRARPKVDRIACPWLIRRFVDPRAVILFVAPSEVEGVAERHDAAPFDIEGVFFSHRGDLCSFDVMLAEFGLSVPALDRLAVIVRGADTARLDLAPEAAGLLAVSLGLSRIHADDLDQLQAGMLVYDAFYRWARDATDETHNWPTNKPGAA